MHSADEVSVCAQGNNYTVTNNEYRYNTTPVLIFFSL